MSAMHSSVRPGTCKLPWGTILKPEFGLGYQRMTEYEIDQTINRLHRIPEQRERTYIRPGPKMEQAEIDEMLRRLTQTDKEKIPDSDRRMAASPNRQMGVLGSYAWKGYN